MLVDLSSTEDILNTDIAVARPCVSTTVVKKSSQAFMFFTGVANYIPSLNQVFKLI